MTNSRFRAFTRCEQFHEYRYMQAYDEAEPAEALLMGSALHIGEEHWWADRDPRGAVEAARKAGEENGLAELYPYAHYMCMALLSGYCEFWKEDEWETVAIEQEFLAPMPDPYFGGQYGDWLISGKIDVVVQNKRTRDQYLMDHKTAGQDITDGSSYWLKLHFDPQISMYFIGSRTLGYNPVGFIYDVLRKPYLKPWKETPVDRRKYRRDGQLKQGQFEVDEVPRDYGIRVLHTILKAPDQFYKRKIFTRSESELERFNQEIIRVCDRIDTYQKSGVYPVRNSGSCSAFGRACPYLEGCMGGDLGESPKLIHKEPFSELDGV